MKIFDLPQRKNVADLWSILSESKIHYHIKINEAASVLLVFFLLGLVFLIYQCLGCVLAFPKSLFAVVGGVARLPGWSVLLLSCRPVHGLQQCLLQHS